MHMSVDIETEFDLFDQSMKSYNALCHLGLYETASITYINVEERKQRFMIAISLEK